MTEDFRQSLIGAIKTQDFEFKDVVMQIIDFEHHHNKQK